MNNKTGLSMVSLRSPEEVNEFSKVWHEKTGNFPEFELSYLMDSDFIGNVESVKGRVLSGHAPCPGIKYLPNLGSRDPLVARESLDSIEASADTVAAFGGDILVLHAGYTLDSPVFTDSVKRIKLLKEYEKQSKYLWLREGSICSPDYGSSEEYSVHMEETLKNLKKASNICMDKGIKLAVENLNPRLTYLFQMPEDFLQLTTAIDNIYICVDIGHLWISSLVHGFDYFAALKLLVSTGRVVSAHIHDNNSVRGNNPHLSDDHGSFGTGTVPIEESISVFIKNSSANLIVESSSDPVKNLELLEQMVLSGN